MRQLLAILIIFLGSSSINCQVKAYGIKLISGLSYMECHFESGIGTNNFSDPIFNYGIGMNYSIALNKLIDLNFEVLLAKRGWSFNISNYFTIDQINAYRTMYGISALPNFSFSLLDFQSRKKVNYRFGINGGGFLSYNPYQTFKYGDFDRIVIREGTSKMDAGLVVGFFLLKSKKRLNPIQLNIRYLKGLINVRTNAKPTQYNMHIFEFGVTYGLSKTK